MNLSGFFVVGWIAVVIIIACLYWRYKNKTIHDPIIKRFSDKTRKSELRKHLKRRKEKGYLDEIIFNERR